MLTLLFSLFSFSSLTKILAAVIDVLSPLAKAAIEFVVWFIKQFFKGLGVTFDNLSVLTVIAAAMVFSAWMFKSIDNDWVLDKCETQVEQLKKQIKSKKTTTYKPSLPDLWPF